MTAVDPLRAIRRLKPGDLIDLHRDPYADPDGDPMTGFEFEYATVEALEREGAGCIVVHTTSDGSFGFPPDHEIPIGGHVSLD